MRRDTTGKYLFWGILFCCVFLFGNLAWAEKLPKGKNIAMVIYETAGGYHATAATGSAEAIIKQALLNNGYPVVNEAQLAKIRQSKAAILALDGNVDAILSLGRTYGVRIFLSGKATMQRAQQNEFGLYTSTAVLAVQAYSASNGKYIFSHTTNAKEVGYTPDEASQKALEKAAANMAQDIVQGEGSAAASQGAVNTLFVVVNGVNNFNVANTVLGACKALSKTKEAKITGFSSGTATIQVIYAGTVDQLQDALSRRGLPVNFTGKSSNAVYAQSL
ncbi:MAG TPA: hypothetical protein PK364_10365 [Synergistaceae bacterium]|nr:hypothetical protein [Synergistaceae bacterium]HPJ26937.1 hypothetical protein [Synergistaceae bacterium]HPQ37910.1 hypothetical protein [Synergistaceae bacterium]